MGIERNRRKKKGKEEIGGQEGSMVTLNPFALAEALSKNTIVGDEDKKSDHVTEFITHLQNITIKENLMRFIKTIRKTDAQTRVLAIEKLIAATEDREIRDEVISVLLVLTPEIFKRIFLDINSEVVLKGIELMSCLVQDLCEKGKFSKLNRTMSQIITELYSLLFSYDKVVSSAIAPIFGAMMFRSLEKTLNEILMEDRLHLKLVSRLWDEFQRYFDYIEDTFFLDNVRSLSKTSKSAQIYLDLYPRYNLLYYIMMPSNFSRLNPTIQQHASLYARNYLAYDTGRHIIKSSYVPIRTVFYRLLVLQGYSVLETGALQMYVKGLLKSKGLEYVDQACICKLILIKGSAWANNFMEICEMLDYNLFFTSPGRSQILIEMLAILEIPLPQLAILIEYITDRILPNKRNYSLISRELTDSKYREVALLNLISLYIERNLLEYNSGLPEHQPKLADLYITWLQLNTDRLVSKDHAEVKKALFGDGEVLAQYLGIFHKAMVLLKSYDTKSIEAILEAILIYIYANPKGGVKELVIFLSAPVPKTDKRLLDLVREEFLDTFMKSTKIDDIKEDLAVEWKISKSVYQEFGIIIPHEYIEKLVKNKELISTLTPEKHEILEEFILDHLPIYSRNRLLSSIKEIVNDTIQKGEEKVNQNSQNNRLVRYTLLAKKIQKQMLPPGSHPESGVDTYRQFIGKSLYQEYLEPQKYIVDPYKMRYEDLDPSILVDYFMMVNSLCAISCKTIAWIFTELKSFDMSTDLEYMRSRKYMFHRSLIHRILEDIDLTQGSEGDAFVLLVECVLVGMATAKARKTYYGDLHELALSRMTTSEPLRKIYLFIRIDVKSKHPPTAISEVELEWQKIHKSLDDPILSKEDLLLYLDSLGTSKEFHKVMQDVLMELDRLFNYVEEEDIDYRDGKISSIYRKCRRNLPQEYQIEFSKSKEYFCPMNLVNGRRYGDLYRVYLYVSIIENLIGRGIVGMKNMLESHLGQYGMLALYLEGLERLYLLTRDWRVYSQKLISFEVIMGYIPEEADRDLLSISKQGPTTDLGNILYFTEPAWESAVDQFVAEYSEEDTTSIILDVYILGLVSVVYHHQQVKQRDRNHKEKSIMIQENAGLDLNYTGRMRRYINGYGDLVLLNYGLDYIPSKDPSEYEWRTLIQKCSMKEIWGHLMVCILMEHKHTMGPWLNHAITTHERDILVRITKRIRQWVVDLVVDRLKGTVKKLSKTPEGFSINCLGLSKEMGHVDGCIRISCCLDEVTFYMELKIGPLYPLRGITCIPGEQSSLTSRQWDGLHLWVKKKIIEGEDISKIARHWARRIRGVVEDREECPVCYTMINPVDHSLPEILCLGCQYRFHADCIYRWFKKSGSSSCPMCRTII